MATKKEEALATKPVSSLALHTEAAAVKNQVNTIQEVMQSVMKLDVHYGTVPGCGKKSSLFKAGAEKLSMAFRLRPIIDSQKDIIISSIDDPALPRGHREVSVYCHILNSQGEELATGVGSCSTLEAKYRYRGGEKESLNTAVPTEYWNLKNAGKATEAQVLIGGPGHGVGKFDGKWEICILGEKLENPDIADQYNTVLKMAKKRAYIDGMLSATGASDIFTQDIEDFHEASGSAHAKPSRPMPESTEKEQPAKESTASQQPEQPKAEDDIPFGGPDNINADMVSAALKRSGSGEIFDVHGVTGKIVSRGLKTKKTVFDIVLFDMDDDKLAMTITFWQKPDIEVGTKVIVHGCSIYKMNSGDLKYSAEKIEVMGAK